MEQISSKALTPGPGVATTLSLSHDDTFYSMESEPSTGVQYQSYNCDVSPTPMMHCTGSKLESLKKKINTKKYLP